MTSWVGSPHLVSCSGYNAPTLLQNLQKRSLWCRERNNLQTGYPLCTGFPCYAVLYDPGPVNMRTFVVYRIKFSFVIIEIMSS